MKVFLSFGLVLSSLAFGAGSEDVTSEIQAASTRCPAVYDPAECSYLDLTASGTNRCEARLALIDLATDGSIEIDLSKIVCQSGL